MSHTCHAAHCGRVVPPRMFACRAHWYRVPPAVQRAIWREYRFGQEQDKKPSASYLAVQQYAVAVLAQRDGYPEDRDAAVVKAVMFEAVAREKEKKEPFAGLPRFWEKLE